MIVNRICEKYGDHVATIDGESYYSFPTLEQLKKGRRPLRHSTDALTH